jgi:hypothetical protein
MAASGPYQYEPRCSWPGCKQLATYKIAAEWSSGTLTELKNYGLCCDEHRQPQIERARASRARFRPADGESLGQVGVYRFTYGERDADLVKLDD